MDCAVEHADQETTAGAPVLELREVTLAYPDGKDAQGAGRRRPHEPSSGQRQRVAQGVWHRS